MVDLGEIPFALSTVISSLKRKNSEGTLVMHFANLYFCLFSFIFWNFLFGDVSCSDSLTLVFGFACKGSDDSGDGYTLKNYVQVMQALNDILATNYFGMHSVLSTKPYTFGLVQCHRDLSPQDCLLCFKEAKNKLDGCIPAAGGSIFLGGCFVRYEHYNFFNETNGRIDQLEPVCHDPTNITSDKYMKADFASKVHQALINVTASAPRNKGFGVSELKSGLLGVYALGQCLENLISQKCKECLSEARVQIDNCLPGAEGHVMNAGCYLRYSSTKFFGDTALTVQKENEQEGSYGLAILAFALLASVLLLFSVFGAFIGYQIYSRTKKGHGRVVQLPSCIRTSELNFSYESLEKATDFFHPSNKLGQGGAGSVYKGTLSDGTVVAVKRLFCNSRQWADEFFNEVHSVSGIQHKNLVRLFGCSIEGPESLLVYEFVPNKNLDQILFDRKTCQLLTWRQRFNIIMGIAEGLAYLHGGCGVKIIHRDIKSSNILHDDSFTPKIADFGLARRVASNKTHISTGVAGTIGYLAPEYLVQGCLTEKADIYAFGVLMIEIACGRKNSIFMHDSGSVLQSVWRSSQSKSISETIDIRLKNEFHEEEASRVLQVGLLCTQTRRLLRPSMSEVVQMLTNEDFPLPSPQQPPFQNSSMLSSDGGSFHSTETNSSSSNWYTARDVLSTDLFSGIPSDDQSRDTPSSNN